MGNRGRTIALWSVGVLVVLAATLLFTQGFHLESDHVAEMNLVLAAEPLSENLSFPVSFAFGPDGRLYYNERFSGNVRYLEDGNVSDVILHEDVVVDIDTGLIGLATYVDPDNRSWIYVYYNDLNARGNMRGHVVRYELQPDGPATNREVIIDSLPAYPMHSSGLIEFGPDGMMYVTVGDTSSEHLVYVPWTRSGKVLRLTPEGDIPDDNPWPRAPSFSLGHRNIFGIAWDARTHHLYVTENGPDHSDEVNLVVPGGNYGWPLTMGHSRLPFINPEVAYETINAPTEMAWYDGDKLDANLTNALFFGTWVGQSLHRLEVDPDTGHVIRDEIVLQGHSFLDVAQGPDGYLYFSDPVGIYRLVPK